jgi:hypothetical protein
MPLVLLPGRLQLVVLVQHELPRLQKGIWQNQQRIRLPSCYPNIVKCLGKWIREVVDVSGANEMGLGNALAVVTPWLGKLGGQAANEGDLCHCHQ